MHVFSTELGIRLRFVKTSEFRGEGEFKVTYKCQSVFYLLSTLLFSMQDTSQAKQLKLCILSMICLFNIIFLAYILVCVHFVIHGFLNKLYL
jgi:hypothetical protein